MHSDHAAITLDADEGKAKQLATFRAKLALAGYALHVIDTGTAQATYMVGRWAMTRTLPDLNAVHQFMRQVGITD